LGLGKPTSGHDGDPWVPEEGRARPVGVGSERDV